MKYMLLFLLAKYWTVHIDTVSDRATYEALNAQESAIQREIYAAHGATRYDLTLTDAADWIQ
jgi:hypothetical protein